MYPEINFTVLLATDRLDSDYEMLSLSALEDIKRLCSKGIISVKGKTYYPEIYNAWIGEPSKHHVGVYATADIKPISSQSRIDLIEYLATHKEASIGYRASEIICSICGKNILKQRCNHRKGVTYPDGICVHIHTRISEMYEWSLVEHPNLRAGATGPRLTDSDVAENLRSNIEGLERAGIEPSMSDRRYVKLAWFEDQEENGKLYW